MFVDCKKWYYLLSIDFLVFVGDANEDEIYLLIDWRMSIQSLFLCPFAFRDKKKRVSFNSFVMFFPIYIFLPLKA